MRHRIVALAALLATLGADPTPAPAPTPQPYPADPAFTTAATAPMTLTTFFDGRAFVQGDVGGRSLWFHLDTGTQTYLLQSAEARTLGLTVDTPTGRTLPVDFIVGGAEAREAKFMVSDYGYDVDGHHIAGILGAPLFYAFVVTIDYKAQRVVVYPPGTFDTRTTGVAAVPLLIHDRSAYISACFGDACGWFLVDTGAEQTLLATPFSDRIRLGPPKGTITTVEWGRVEQTDPVYDVPVMTFAGVPIRFDALAAEDLKNSYRTFGDGIIGRDVLSHFVVTLDWRDGTAYFAPIR
jgi:Aspartyl protease